MHMGESLKSDSIEETAEEIALTTAQELTDQEQLESKDDGDRITRLEEFPPVIHDLKPDVEEPGIRGWLING